jgi:hypothetical protein
MHSATCFSTLSIWRERVCGGDGSRERWGGGERDMREESDRGRERERGRERKRGRERERRERGGRRAHEKGEWAQGLSESKKGARRRSKRGARRRSKRGARRREMIKRESAGMQGIIGIV